jgi:hypothetical protein
MLIYTLSNTTKITMTLKPLITIQCYNITTLTTIIPVITLTKLHPELAPTQTGTQPTETK